MRIEITSVMFMEIELVMEIGFMDECFVGGGHEDHDFSIRIAEARVPYYSSEILLPLYTIRNKTNWNYRVSRVFYFEKWQFKYGTTIRKIPDIPYDGSLGPKSNDTKWYNESCFIHDSVRGKIPVMRMDHIIDGKYTEALNQCLLTKYEEFRYNEHNWPKLTGIINAIIGFDSPMKNLEMCDDNSVSFFLDNSNYKDVNEETTLFDTIIIPCYRHNSEILELFTKIITRLKVGGYIILHGWGKSSFYYDANIFEGQIYLAIESIKKIEGYDTIVFPIHPGVCIVRKQL